VGNEVFWHSEIYSDFEGETEFIGDYSGGIIQLEDMTVLPVLIIHFTESVHRCEEKSGLKSAHRY
jgi:hypothetical protein